ncbi:MAG: DUF6899 family protein [Atribacterota bacterium]
MPYIKREDRDKFIKTECTGMQSLMDFDELKELSKKIDNCGELNYVISVICNEYYKRNGGRYQQINDIVGALEGAKMEYYRRVASPYEDKKIEENGDVY